MKNKTKNWGGFIIFLIIIGFFFLALFMTIEYNERKDFCEGELKGSFSKGVCLFERDGIIYGLKLIKYNDTWKVLVD